MRYLSRLMVVVCMAALLALPAHASQPQRTQKPAAISSSRAISAWLGSLWGDLVRLVAPGTSQPVPSGIRPARPNVTDLPQLMNPNQGGSCIDPDGCS